MAKGRLELRFRAMKEMIQQPLGTVALVGGTGETSRWTSTWSVRPSSRFRPKRDLGGGSPDATAFPCPSKSLRSGASTGDFGRGRRNEILSAFFQPLLIASRPARLHRACILRFYSWLLSGCGAPLRRRRRVSTSNRCLAAVRAAVQDNVRGGQIRRISKEAEDGVEQYEVESRLNGKERDFGVDSRGVLLVVEEETVIDTIPPAAKAAF
jgi:hypothetical protein